MRSVQEILSVTLCGFEVQVSTGNLLHSAFLQLYEKLEQKDMEILAQQNNLSHVKATTEQLCER